MTTINGIPCAFCKGIFRQSASYNVFRCADCGRKNLVVFDSKHQIFEVRSHISDRNAIRSVSDYLKLERNVAPTFFPVLQRESECRLYFVPFYDTEGMSAVRFKAKKFDEKRSFKRTSDGRQHMISVAKTNPKVCHYDTRIHIQEFRHSMCAVADLNWGLDSVRVNDDAELDIGDMTLMQSRGVVLSPTVSHGVFTSQNQLLGSRAVELSRDDLFSTERLYFIPVWRITTRFEGFVYESFVNAESGECLKSVAPLSVGSRATAFSVSFTVMAFLSSLTLVLSHTLYKILATDIDSAASGIDVMMYFLYLPILAVISILAALAGYGWDRLRYRMEVIKQGGSVLVNSGEKQQDSWLSRLHESTLKTVSKTVEGIFNIHE